MGDQIQSANQYTLTDNNQYALPGTFTYSYKRSNEDLGKTWEYDFHLTQAQMDTLNQLEKNNPDISEYDIFNKVVPDQVAALPADLQSYIKQLPYHMKNTPGDIQSGYQYDPTTGIGIDPSGTVVPKELVPNEVLRGLDPGYSGPMINSPSMVDTDGYTPETASHLANLGLSTDTNKTNLNVASSLSGGQYTITLTGTTPDGARKSWTFVIDDNKIWHDTSTGAAIDEDAQYILSALMYMDPPNDKSIAKQVSTSTSPQVSLGSKGLYSSVNPSSLLSKSSQYNQSIHNPSITTNILIPKIVVSSSSPIVQNTGILPLKAESINIGASNLPPVTLPLTQFEKTAKISLPLSGTAFPKNIAFV